MKFQQINTTQKPKSSKQNKHNYRKTVMASLVLSMIITVVLIFLLKEKIFQSKKQEYTPVPETEPPVSQKTIVVITDHSDIGIADVLRSMTRVIEIYSSEIVPGTELLGPQSWADNKRTYEKICDSICLLFHPMDEISNYISDLHSRSQPSFYTNITEIVFKFADLLNQVLETLRSEFIVSCFESNDNLNLNSEYTFFLNLFLQTSTRGESLGLFNDFLTKFEHKTNDLLTEIKNNKHTKGYLSKFIFIYKKLFNNTFVKKNAKEYDNLLKDYDKLEYVFKGIKELREFLAINSFLIYFTVFTLDESGFVVGFKKDVKKFYFPNSEEDEDKEVIVDELNLVHGTLVDIKEGCKNVFKIFDEIKTDEMDNFVTSEEFIKGLKKTEDECLVLFSNMSAFDLTH